MSGTLSGEDFGLPVFEVRCGDAQFEAKVTPYDRHLHGGGVRQMLTPQASGEYIGRLNAAGVAWARRMVEDIDRREWVEQVRQRYGLVTIDGGMPRQPCGMTADGQYEGWHRTGGICGRVDSPERWVRSGDRRAWDGLTDWQILGLLNEMMCREAEYHEPRNAELRSWLTGGTVSRGRQYETDEVHPPEWSPG